MNEKETVFLILMSLCLMFLVSRPGVSASTQQTATASLSNTSISAQY